MISYNWFGKIRDAHLPDEVREQIAEWLKKYDGKTVQVQLQEYSPTKKEALQKFYRKFYVKEFSDHTGYTTFETHNLFKKMFLGFKTLVIQGEEYQTLNSTRDLSIDGWFKYLLDIRVWAGMKHNLSLPEFGED